MSDEFDPFQLSTGLPDKLDFCIQEAWFEFDPEYNNGQTLLLKFNVESTDDEFGEHGQGILMYPTGSGWDQEQNGQVAMREDGNVKKGFHQQSAYGLFIRAAIDCDGAEPVLRSEGRGDPRLAGMWVNTCWHVDRVERDYGGDIGKVSRLLPSAFLGEGTSIHAIQQGGAQRAGAVKKAAPVTKATGPTKAAGATKAAGPPQKAAGATKAAGPVKKAALPMSPPAMAGGAPPVAPQAQAPAPAATPAPQPPVAELPPEPDNGDGGLEPGSELYTTLYNLAWASEDHNAFVEQAFTSVDGVTGNPAIEQAVMNDGEGSLWAQVVADYAAAQG